MGCGFEGGYCGLGSKGGVGYMTSVSFTAQHQHQLFILQMWEKKLTTARKSSLQTMILQPGTAQVVQGLGQLKEFFKEKNKAIFIFSNLQLQKKQLSSCRFWATLDLTTTGTDGTCLQSAKIDTKDWSVMWLNISAIIIFRKVLSYRAGVAA